MIYAALRLFDLACFLAYLLVQLFKAVVAIYVIFIEKKKTITQKDETPQ